MNKRTWAVIENAGQKVDLALWSLLIAFLIFFALFVAPRVPENQARQERIHIRQVTAENSSYCAKWGMAPGSHQHTLCTMDLQELRAKIERQFAAENGSF
ncbi:MAG TPA: hypothetical protein VFB45_24435 [Pseudolabrys sp.]|nr:hypothetical protein [Pseudolabrys sp.]